VAALALAAVADLLVGEPPERIHPVVLFGRIVALFDRQWASPKIVGAVVAVVLPLFAATVAAGATLISLRVDPWLGIAVGGLLVFSTISLRLLVETAREVIGLTDTEIDSARSDVRALVGRETETLGEGELRSAAVESAAENLADGLVGPLFAFALGVQGSLIAGAGAELSLAIGVGSAAVLKAVNTLDSMLGYRSKPVGTASARLDDLLMWIPARISAVLIALAALDPGALWRARGWASEPSSPNSGWPMATMAAVGGVQLSKREAYTLNPAASLPTAAEASHCLRVVTVAGAAAFVLTGVVVWF